MSLQVFDVCGRVLEDGTFLRLVGLHVLQGQRFNVLLVGHFNDLHLRLYPPVMRLSGNVDNGWLWSGRRGCCGNPGNLPLAVVVVGFVVEKGKLFHVAVDIFHLKVSICGLVLFGGHRSRPVKGVVLLHKGRLRLDRLPGHVLDHCQVHVDGDIGQRLHFRPEFHERGSHSQGTETEQR